MLGVLVRVMIVTSMRIVTGVNRALDFHPPIVALPPA